MKKSIRSFSDDSGQILVLTALSMTVLLAVAALSLDVSFMYDKRNRLHAAADAAAKSGAIEVKRNASISNGDLQTFANQQVAAHGFNPASTTSVVVRHAPTTGPYTGNMGYVEVIVSEPTGTFFGGLLGLMSMTPGARAVAGTGSGPNCIITLGPPTAIPESMSMSNSTLNMPTCSVANGGDLETTNPNADINAMDIAVTGACSGMGCSNMGGMTTGAPSPSDPLAALADPANPGSCVPLTVPTNTVHTIPAGDHCYSSITLNNNSTLNIGAGMIYLTGRFGTGNGPLINGTGVMIYLAGTAATGACTTLATAGCMDITNGMTFNMSAPTSGPYEGILFFQARTNQLDANFTGNGSPVLNLSGAMYFPSSDVAFRNGLSATNDCMLLVARSFSILNGNGMFSNNCSSYGGSPLLTVSIAE